MVLEAVTLQIRAGEHDAYEAAFAKAKHIIATVPGFQHLELSRSVETPGRYLLLIGWNRLEDHTVGFRESPEYERWRGLLHHFYESFPDVEHYEQIAQADPSR